MAKSSGARLSVASICLAIGLVRVGYGQTPFFSVRKVLLSGTSARRLGADWQRDHLALLKSPRMEERVGALHLYTYVMDVKALPVLVQLARSQSQTERRLAATSFSRQFPLVRAELSRLNRARDGEGHKQILQEFNAACKDPDVSLVMYCDNPQTAELYLNAGQDILFARKALEYEANLFSPPSKSLENSEKRVSQSDLDWIPRGVCGNEAGPVVTKIVSRSFPHVYLDSVRRAKGAQKALLIASYVGSWTVAFENELYEFVRESESSWPLFGLFVKHPRQEATSLLRKHLHSRWARVRLWSTRALVDLEPRNAWEVLTEGLSSDRSEEACFFLWQDLLDLKDRRSAFWVRSVLQNSSAETTRRLLHSLPILDDSQIAKVVADYALNPRSAERIAAFEALRNCDLPEADALFMTIVPESPRELQLLWCARVGNLNDATALPRLRIYAKSSDAELAEIAASAIRDIVRNLNQNDPGR